MIFMAFVNFDAFAEAMGSVCPTSGVAVDLRRFLHHLRWGTSHLLLGKGVGWGSVVWFIFIWVTKIFMTPIPAPVSPDNVPTTSTSPTPQEKWQKPLWPPWPTHPTFHLLPSQNSNYTYFMSKSPELNLYEIQGIFIYFLQVNYSSRLMVCLLSALFPF